METQEYVISKIEGEYAYLHRTDKECDEDVFIALALLPPNVDIGTELKYEMMLYSVKE